MAETTTEITCYLCSKGLNGKRPAGFEGPDINGVFWNGTVWQRFLCDTCVNRTRGSFVPDPSPVRISPTPATLLLPSELQHAIRQVEDLDPGTMAQAMALDAVIRHVAALERALARARDTIAVLYVGAAARRADGSLDIDAVINGVLGGK